MWENSGGGDREFGAFFEKFGPRLNFPKFPASSENEYRPPPVSQFHEIIEICENFIPLESFSPGESFSRA